MNIKVALFVGLVVFTGSVFGFDGKAFAGASLPCSLQGNYKPVLNLYGEEHGNSNSELRKMMEMIEAGKGTRFLGLEGFFYDQPQDPVKFVKNLGLWTSQSRVFGFDAEFPYGQSVLLRLDLEALATYSKKSTNQVKPEEAVSAFNYSAFLIVRQLNVNPYVKEAWDNLFAQVPMSTTAQKMKATAESFPTDEVAQRQIKIFDMKDQNIDAQEQDFLRTLNGLAFSYAVMADSDKYKTKMNTPSDIIKTVTEFLKGNDYKGAIDKLGVQWRNEEIIRNISELYCEASKEKKDLVIVIGALHVDGVKKAFEEMGQKQIEIKVTDTTKPLPGFENLPVPPKN